MSADVPPRALLASLDAATLAEVVATSRSWRQVRMRLAANRHTRALRARCEQEGIPHDHLGHAAPPDALMRSVLSTAGSWPQAMAELGFAVDSGSARASIRKHARRLGLDVAALDQPPDPAPTGLPGMEPQLRHLRSAGPYIVASAFVLAGHTVSWPLEPTVHDLLVDAGGRLLRVQVKTTSRRSADSWLCSITRSEYERGSGGKRSVRYSPDAVDAFAVVDGDGEVYLIPMEDVVGLTALSLRRYTAYRLPQLSRVPASCDESG